MTFRLLWGIAALTALTSACGDDDDKFPTPQDGGHDAATAVGLDASSPLDASSSLDATIADAQADPGLGAKNAACGMGSQCTSGFCDLGESDAGGICVDMPVCENTSGKCTADTDCCGLVRNGKAYGLCLGGQCAVSFAR